MLIDLGVDGFGYWYASIMKTGIERDMGLEIELILVSFVHVSTFLLSATSVPSVW